MFRSWVTPQVRISFLEVLLYLLKPLHPVLGIQVDLRLLKMVPNDFPCSKTLDLTPKPCLKDVQKPSYRFGKTWNILKNAWYSEKVMLRTQLFLTWNWNFWARFLKDLLLNFNLVLFLGCHGPLFEEKIFCHRNSISSDISEQLPPEYTPFLPSTIPSLRWLFLPSTLPSFHLPSFLPPFLPSVDYSFRHDSGDSSSSRN